VIFKLVECVTNNATSYTWEEMGTIHYMFLGPFNTHGKLLSFHPYHEVVYFKRGSVLYFYFYDLEDNHIDIIDPAIVEHNKIVYDYIKNCGQPLLDCFASFVCCLDKKVIYCTNFTLLISLVLISLFCHNANIVLHL